MSPIMSSQGVVLATAMAVSGTVILLAFRRQQKTPHFPLLQISQPFPPSCIITGKKKKQKKKKRVHFAEDVVDPIGNSDEYRKLHCNKQHSNSLNKGGNFQEMPPNRVALYNGILRDRVHKVPY